MRTRLRRFELSPRLEVRATAALGVQRPQELLADGLSERASQVRPYGSLDYKEQRKLRSTEFRLQPDQQRWSRRSFGGPILAGG